MRLLDNALPSECELRGGRVVSFETDFRTWMQFENLFLDKDIPDDVKPFLAKRLIFPVPVKEDVSGFLLWFYRLGKPPAEKTAQYKGRGKTARVYSFEHDEELIFSAFMQCYHIDLCETYMHWWKFKALFDGLSGDTKLKEVMGYRAVDTDKNMSGERARHYKELKEIYRLPRYLSEEQKNAELKRILREGRKGL